ncbi:hypothetical protein TrST_g13100 [Triparma strigata]|uniref:Uncharacterized protein n=1 Tax=Triparma strigata TaxID=1606541 RepID=A0A9W7AT45_9STRA|nr:hypothetical protein TrST_g13100 [Triparma strigata]
MSSSSSYDIIPSPSSHSRRNNNYWKEDEESERLRTELAALRKALDETTSLLSKSQRSSLLQSSKVTSLQSSLTSSKAALQTSQSEITSLQTLNAALSAQLTSSKNSETQLINRMLTEKQSMITQITETTDLLTSLKSELERTKKELASALLELAEIKEGKGDVVLRKSEGEVSGNFGIFESMIPKSVGTIFRPHSSCVMDLKCSGTSYLTAGGDSYLKLIKGGRVVQSYGGQIVQPVCCCDVGYGKIVGGGVDKVVRVWEEGGRSVANIQGHGGKIVGVNILEATKVVSVAADRSLRLWDLGRRGSMVSTNKHPSSFNCLSAPLTGGSTCCTGHSDGGLRIWDLKSNALAADIPNIHTGNVTSVKYHPTESSVVFCLGRDNLVKVVDLRMCEVLHTLGHVDFRIGCNWTSFGVSPDGCNVACGSTSGDLFIWDVASSKMIKKLKGHREQVVAVAWGSGGEGQVVSGDKGGSVIVWN